MQLGVSIILTFHRRQGFHSVPKGIGDVASRLPVDDGGVERGLSQAGSEMVARPSGLVERRLREDCAWSPSLLAAAALMWAWGDETTPGGRFVSARRLVVHLFVPATPLAGSDQSFVNLLRRGTVELMDCLKRGLRERMQHHLARDWSVLDLVMFAVDGSRCELARTVSNERACSATRPSKKSHTRTGRKSKRKIKPGSTHFQQAALRHLC